MIIQKRFTLKQELFKEINAQKNIGKIKRGSPISDVRLNVQIKETIDTLIQSLESLNPNPHPLLNSPQLLDGIWQLNYATAKEIRRLSSLKYGLQTGAVYQVIDLSTKSFFNQAFVNHKLGLVSGYVLVNAIFEAAKDSLSDLPNDTLNIDFKKRYLAINKIVNIQTPKLDPFKVIPANKPQQRKPTFKITYLDEDLRIGRGGEGGLYILSKSPNTQAIEDYYKFIQENN
ncbi:MAG: PAP/fibrillin family protein [Crocosphaera sp.]